MKSDTTGPMDVRVIHIRQSDGVETVEQEYARLEDLLDGDEYEDALALLRREGRAYVGGGASPLYLLFALS